jgi:Tol biopolymer transport system component
LALTPGTRLGVYEVAAQIGEGGMGQVYRATDTKLKRQVAIKILPPSLALDADRLARFQREAEMLASLNHPHIAAIYGLEDADGGRALVMELVEGEDLSQRIARGAIPIDEALPIAKQIAEALEAAHEQGIIHRDLKPANVKVRPDGTVKVLDFGLAKAMESPAANAPSVSQSPTITTPAMTQAGMLLGTAAYMSPEQARGKPVDKRVDIWAFGAVLFEMLTGKRAFAGEDVSDVLASVLAREPDWRLLPRGLPPVVGNYLKRCLHKDRKQRIRDIGDVLLALDGAFEAVAPDVAHSVAVARSVWRRALPVAVTAIAATLITGLAAWRLWPSVERRSATRFDYVLPEGQQLEVTQPQRPVMATSPDGRSFVYQTTEGLYLRSMGNLEAQLTPGTKERLSTPFFSPDGQWVGYFVLTGQANDRQLKKIAVSGGGAVILCAATIPFGASWTPDNTILFGQRAGIMRVSANGGTPELIIRASESEQMYGPQLLPDRASVLFSVTREMGPSRWDQAQVVVQSLSSGKRSVVVQGGSDARYVPTGHVVYALRDGLFAIAFDADRLRVTGGTVPLVQGVQRPVGVNAAASNYAVSEQGTLVYLTRGSSLRSLVWMNRNGAAAGPISPIPPGTYEDPRVSPDGDRVLVTRQDDVWIYDVATGRSSRLTRDGSSLMGVWDPTGSQIAYSSARTGNLEAWVEPSDGSGPPRQLTNLGGQVHVDSWSPDGRTLTMHHHPPEGPTSIFMLSMDTTDPKPRVFLKGEFNAEGAYFSRDGRYVAYVADATGQREIYIRPYSNPGGQVTVSVGGGREPMWANNGDLFYRSLTGERMFAVSVTTKPALKVERPVELFQGPYYISSGGSPRPQYDVTPDGQRFLLLASAPGTNGSVARPRMVVVQNWFDELKRLVPTH